MTTKCLTTYDDVTMGREPPRTR